VWSKNVQHVLSSWTRKCEHTWTCRVVWAFPSVGSYGDLNTWLSRTLYRVRQANFLFWIWNAIWKRKLTCRTLYNNDNNNDNVTGWFRHYSVPYVPEIEGVETFKGSVQHSKAYRSAEAYRNLRVVVLGAASSGMDIGMEIATVAHQVRNHSCGCPPSQVVSVYCREN
jgi:hypothetical protein